MKLMWETFRRMNGSVIVSPDIRDSLFSRGLFSMSKSWNKLDSDQNSIILVLLCCACTPGWSNTNSPPPSFSHGFSCTCLHASRLLASIPSALKRDARDITATRTTWSTHTAKATSVFMHYVEAICLECASSYTMYFFTQKQQGLH